MFGIDFTAKYQGPASSELFSTCTAPFTLQRKPPVLPLVPRFAVKFSAILFPVAGVVVLRWLVSP